MKRALAIWAITLVSNFSANYSWSAENTEDVAEIAIAGDSWAYLLCFDNAYNKAIANLELDGFVMARGCTSTSKIGIQANEWVDSNQRAKLIQTLQNNPNIKFVHLSLGGNDLINGWNDEMSLVDEANLFYRTYQDIRRATDEILKNSKAQVIVSGYDFPRFTPDHPIANYRKIYERLGSPEARDLNQAMIRHHEYLHDQFENHRQFRRRVYIQTHIGLLHYYAGIPEQGIPPETTLAPDQISNLENMRRVGGDTRYAADIELLRSYTSRIFDPFHLGRIGHELLAQHTLENIIIPLTSESFR